MLLACAGLLVQPVAAQEGTWTLSGGAGYAAISLSAVRNDMERDVNIYNSVGHELPPFPSPVSALALNARGSYRFDRDYSFSLNAYYDGRTVETSWSSTEDELSLKRRIKATVVSAGLSYHFPSEQDTDLYAEIQLGMLFARATSYALWKHTEKLSDTTLTLVTEILDDTRGIFVKSKMIVSASLGGSVRLFGPLIFRGELTYRLGQIGKIDGTVTKFGQTTDQTTSVEFDFSGALILATIGYEFP